MAISDYQLHVLATKAQEDARRCYQIYDQCRTNWEKHGKDEWDRHDVVVWQHRSMLAYDHAVEMLSIVLQRRDYHVG